MKALHWMLRIGFAMVLIAGIYLFTAKKLAREAIALRMLYATNHSSGGQVAVFCLSNQTSTEMTYLGDGTLEPYWLLMEERIIKTIPGKPIRKFIATTNYNEKPYARVKPVIFLPHASVTFPVHIPAVATGASLTVSYMTKDVQLTDVLRDVARFGWKGLSSRAYSRVELTQPFTPTPGYRFDPTTMPDSAKPASDSPVASAGSGFVRVAVIEDRTVSRIHKLFTAAGVKVSIDRMLVSDGIFSAGYYTVSVPMQAKPQALSLIRKDAPTGKYWIHAE